MRRPLVAVFMVTYNQEKYVGQAIESVLNQRTAFSIKLFIGDDCSTDKTASICLKYQENNPEIISVILNKRNIGALNNAIQIYSLCFSSGAKYIAMLEGDDFWSDPYKLQIQVDFLEMNDDYVVSCHDAAIVDSEGEIICRSKLPPSAKKDFTRDELMCGALLLTLSICYRNILKEIPPEYGKVFNGDTFLISMLGVYGKSKFQGEIEPAGYRSHQGGIWSSKSASQRREEQLRTYYYIFRFHKRIKSELTVVNALFEKYFNRKYDSFYELIREKKYNKAFTALVTLVFDCLRFGYFALPYKKVKKSFKAFFKEL